ncbi:6385_t:CDS:2, partial [Acaulospora colombiana]
MSSEVRAGTSRSASSTSKTWINAYLVLYNVASWIGWAYVLGSTLSTLAQNNVDYTIVYDRIGWSLAIVQTGAILE